MVRLIMSYAIMPLFATDNEENFVDEGAEDFRPPEPQSKSEARGI